MKLWEKGKLKPMDLRLGNYIANSAWDNQPMYIVSMGLDDEKDAYLYLDFDGNEADLWEEYLTDVSALPINESDNLLEQFGFIYDEPTGKWIAIKETETIYLKQNGDKYDVFTHGEDGVHGKVEYIHQLQNFVYDKLDIELR